MSSMAHPEASLASIGLRAKTGRAIAVVLVGSGDSPLAVGRAELSLVSAALPATSQPYHEVMDLPWEKARAAARKTETAIEAVASRALEGLLREVRSEGRTVCRVAIVGAPDRNLEAIGNPHIRAHAAEGVLFRRVLEVAAEANDLPWRAFSDRNLEKLAASELGVRVPWLKARLDEMGRAVGRPWRVDEKAAATGAWLALAEHLKK
jgi:hypothetical protein